MTPGFTRWRVEAGGRDRAAALIWVWKFFPLSFLCNTVTLLIQARGKEITKLAATIIFIHFVQPDDCKSLPGKGLVSPPPSILYFWIRHCVNPYNFLNSKLFLSVVGESTSAMLTVTQCRAPVQFGLSELLPWGREVCLVNVARPSHMRVAKVVSMWCAWMLLVLTSI